MVRQLTKRDIDVGGEWFQRRKDLELVARKLGSIDYEVHPLNVIQGPYCSLTDLEGDLWFGTESNSIEADQGKMFYFKPKSESLNKEDFMFFEDEAIKVGELIKENLKKEKKNNVIGLRDLPSQENTLLFSHGEYSVHRLRDALYYVFNSSIMQNKNIFECAKDNNIPVFQSLEEAINYIRSVEG